MSTTTDFDRLARAWLDDGPRVLSDRALDAALAEIHLTRQRRALRVPRRFPLMNALRRTSVLAAFALAAVIGTGAFLYLNQPGTGTGSTPPPSSAPTGGPTSTSNVATFTSPLYGYTVTRPTGWRVTPATVAWRQGVLANEAFDLFAAPESQSPDYDDVLVAAQPIPEGMTPADWLLEYANVVETSPRECTGPADGWTESTVGSLAIRRLDLECQGAPGETLHVADVAFVLGGTGYVMSGNPTVISQFLAEFKPGPTAAPTAAALGVSARTTYASAIYELTLGYPSDWSVKTPATRTWAGEALPTDGAFQAGDFGYADTFVSPGEAGSQIALVALQGHIDIFGEPIDLKAVAVKFCHSLVGTSSCETFTQRAEPLDFGNGNRGGCAFLVPTADRQYAFLSDVGNCVVREETSWITVLVIDREDQFPSAIRYGGSVALLESIVKTMSVWRPGQQPGT